MMKFKLLLALMTVILILGTQACARQTPAVGEPASGQVLFQDDFTTPGNWDIVNQDQEGSTDYLNESYVIKVNTANTDIWANPKQNPGFDNVLIEVEAANISDMQDNEFGVICRYQDINNFYYFAITSDGYFGIFKVKNGVNILINRTEMLPTDVIKTGKELNQIQAECNGATLTLSVNGQFLDQQEDSEFISGNIGLIAGTFEEPGAAIQFEKINVKRP